MHSDLVSIIIDHNIIYREEGSCSVPLICTGEGKKNDEVTQKERIDDRPEEDQEGGREERKPSRHPNGAEGVDKEIRRYPATTRRVSRVIDNG